MNDYLKLFIERGERHDEYGGIRSKSKRLHFKNIGKKILKMEELLLLLSSSGRDNDLLLRCIFKKRAIKYKRYVNFEEDKI